MAVILESHDKGRKAYCYIVQVNIGKIYSDFCLNKVVMGYSEFPDFQHKTFGKLRSCICSDPISNVQYLLQD